MQLHTLTLTLTLKKVLDVYLTALDTAGACNENHLPAILSSTTATTTSDTTESTASTKTRSPGRGTDTDTGRAGGHAIGLPPPDDDPDLYHVTSLSDTEGGVLSPGRRRVDSTDGVLSFAARTIQRPRTPNTTAGGLNSLKAKAASTTWLASEASMDAYVVLYLCIHTFTHTHTHTLSLSLSLPLY